MHAVGDVADRNLVFELAGIEPGPHGARNFTVQGRNGVGAPRKFQAQHRHAELFVMIVRLLAAQRHQRSCEMPERLAQGPKVFFDQTRMKAVMAGGNRRMGGENHFAGRPAAQPVRS